MVGSHSAGPSYPAPKGHPDEIRDIAERCAPGLWALMFHAVPGIWKSDSSLALPLFALAEKLRELGVEIDQGGMCAKVYSSFRARSASSDTDTLAESQLNNDPSVQPG
jgi:hypothetical protein